jgi:hypothetical protein
MTFSTETLVAYADGELDAATRADIEAEIPHDPELAQAVAVHVQQRAALQAKVHAGLDGALTQDVPASLLAAVESPASNNIVDLTLRRFEGTSPSRTSRWSWSQWAAIAGALLCGVIVGRLIPSRNDNPFIEERGRVVARGPLAMALTEQSGGIIDRETGIQIGVSYLAKNGDYCRTFTLKDQQALAGLACRRDAQWMVDALTRTKADASSAYRMAGASVPALILGLVEDTIAGDPLDAEQEVEARERGWER